MQVFTCISQKDAGANRLPVPGPAEILTRITEWLLSQPEVRQVRAHTLTDNAPSRRVLEKAGFRYLGLDEGEALYQRD